MVLKKILVLVQEDNYDFRNGTQETSFTMED